MRRRFELNEGIVGWGQGAFAAVPHHVDTPLDWRGPYPAAAPGGYAAPGHAGLLGILPGSWGPAQTGVSDSVPSPTGDIALWLHVIEIPDGPSDLARLRLEPLAPLDGWRWCRRRSHHGFPRDRVAAGPRAAADPPVGGRSRASGPWPSTSARCSGSVRLQPRSRHEATSRRRSSGGGPRGSTMDPTGGVLVDLAMAADATIDVGGERRLGGAAAGRWRPAPFGAVTIESLPARTHRVDVEMVDARTGEPVPARVRFEAADGRYLQPLGHRDEINPGLNEDTGADLVLGGATYAYVPGRFPIELPVGDVQVEVVRGFGYRPLRLSVDSRRWSGAACPAARAGRRAGRHRLDRRRLPRPFHLTHVGAPPGAGRGRGHRQPAGDAMGRPPHEHRRPAGRRRRRPIRRSTWWSWAARTARTCSATSASSARRMPCCRWRAPAPPKRAWATRSIG